MMSQVDAFTITGKNEDGVVTATHTNGYEYGLEPMSGKWYRKVANGLYAQVSKWDNRRLNMAYVQYMRAAKGDGDVE